MPRKKTTLYIDEALLRAAKTEAARSGRSDSDVMEAALRNLLELAVVDRVWARNRAEPVSADEALAIAYDELDATRRSRRGRAS